MVNALVGKRGDWIDKNPVPFEKDTGPPLTSSPTVVPSSTEPQTRKCNVSDVSESENAASAQTSQLASHDRSSTAGHPFPNAPVVDYRSEFGVNPNTRHDEIWLRKPVIWHDGSENSTFSQNNPYNGNSDILYEIGHFLNASVGKQGDSIDRGPVPSKKNTGSPSTSPPRWCRRVRRPSSPSAAEVQQWSTPALRHGFGGPSTLICSVTIFYDYIIYRIKNSEYSRLANYLHN